MRELNFLEIVNKIRKIDFGSFDLVVAIGRGGLVPASLIAKQLNIQMHTLWLRFKDDSNNEIYPEPKLVKEVNFDFQNKNILLVDDFSKTGKTMQQAKKLLQGAEIKTFVVNGSADYSLYQFKECLKFPWN